MLFCYRRDDSGHATARVVEQMNNYHERATAGAVTGDPEPAIAVRSDSAGDVHQRPREDGRTGKSSMADFHRMDHDGADHHAQPQADIRLVARVPAVADTSSRRVAIGARSNS